MYKSKTNLAVLISGPLRTFVDVWPKNLIVLDKLNLNYKCFMHTWDKNFDTYKNIFESSNSNFFWRWSPKKLKNYHGQPSEILSTFSEEWIVKIENIENAYSNFPRIEINTKQKQMYLNSIAMYYGMKEVAQLAILGGEKFTHFLRIRSDAILPKRFNFNESKNLVMYGGTVSIFGKKISDQCFSGDFQETIKSMFVIDTLQNAVASEGWFNTELALPRYAENSMYEHLSKIGLLSKVQVTPKKNMVLIIRNSEIPDNSISYFNFYKACMQKNKKIWIKKAFKITSYFANKLKISGFLKKLFSLKNFSNLD
jgi:hypothetical protein